MMTAQDMVNYVVASAQLVDACQQKLRKQASEIEQLKAEKIDKKASSIVLDENKLMKAANDMHTIYGKPSQITPEQLASYWRSNPNTMLDTMQKLAAAQLERTVNGEHIGSAKQEAPHQKKAAAVAGYGEDAATAALWSKYSN